MQVYGITDMVYPPIDGHPSKYLLGLA